MLWATALDVNRQGYDVRTGLMPIHSEMNVGTTLCFIKKASINRSGKTGFAVAVSVGWETEAIEKGLQFLVGF